MYSEVLRNLEITRFSLMNNTPLIQIIDGPRYPLPYEKPSKRKALIIGGFLGGFLCCLYLIMKKILSNLMD